MSFKLIDKLPVSVTRGAHNVYRWGVRNSPWLSVGAGIGLAVYSGVALYKARPAIEEGIAEMERAKAGVDGASKKEGMIKVAKAVAIPTIGATASALLILNGPRILSKRLATVSGAYTVLQDRYTKYTNWLKENHPEVVTQMGEEIGQVPLDKQEAQKKNPKTVEAVKNPARFSEAGFFADMSPVLRDIMDQDDEFDFALLETMVRHIVEDGNGDGRSINSRMYRNGYVTLANVWAAFEIPKESLKSHPDCPVVDYRRGRDLIWTDSAPFDYRIDMVNEWVEEDGVRFRKVRPYISFVRPPRYGYAEIDEA